MKIGTIVHYNTPYLGKSFGIVNRKSYDVAYASLISLKGELLCIRIQDFSNNTQVFEVRPLFFAFFFPRKFVRLKFMLYHELRKANNK